MVFKKTMIGSKNLQLVKERNVVLQMAYVLVMLVCREVLVFGGAI